MIPHRLLAVAVLLIAFAIPASAQPCTADASGTCALHKHLAGSGYPYTEDFAHGHPQVHAGAGWTTVVEGCAARDFVNFAHTEPVHAVIRGTLRVKGATAPPGSRLGIRFTIDGVARGEYLRTLSGSYHQSEEINVIVPVDAGEHRIAMQAWLVDGPGSITLGISFLTAQGVPSRSAAARSTLAEPVTIDTRWRKITETITLNAATDVHLLVQGYLQLDSATPDASHLTLGFSLDGENSQHTLEIALPKFYPSGINLFDHIRQQPGFANVPAGRHTITLWAIVRGGGTVEARFRQVEAIAFDATDDRLTPMLETAETEPLVVTPRGDGTVVFNQWLTEARCGNWTKLLEYDYPVTPLRNTNSVGEAYVEFLGSASGEPQFVQVAIEVLNDPVFDADGDPIARQLDTDFSILEFMIPPGRSQKFLFTHALWWGTHRPNHIRLLARAMTCFGQPATDFRVGKRHMAIKMIPTSGTTSCQYD